MPAAHSFAQGHWHGGGGWGGGGWGGGGWHGGGWHGGTNVVVGFGPGWGWGYGGGYGWGPGWYYPPPYYYGAGYYGYPYSYGPPVVVQQQPQQYIQQEPAQTSLPAGYWYYCASARGYYPSVPTCPEAWIQVPPAPSQE
jgi:hypothetical protein